MKVTLTNAEIESYLNMLADPKSFRNNIAVKMPSAEAGWAIRVNIKILSDRFSIYDEARKDLGKEFIQNGKVEEDGQHIKKEFMGEYVYRLGELAGIHNTMDLTPLSKNDADKIIAFGLSLPEEDFIMAMTEEMDEEE